MKIKRILIVLTTILMLIGMESCSPQKQTDMSKILSGNHSLRKMNCVSINQKSSLSGFFMMGFGGVSGDSDSERTVTFAWKHGNNNYVISSLPIEKIRIEIDNGISVPYVKFNFDDDNCYSTNHMAYAFPRIINYMTIVCRDDQWKININLPMNGKGE